MMLPGAGPPGNMHHMVDACRPVWKPGEYRTSDLDVRQLFYDNISKQRPQKDQ